MRLRDCFYNVTSTLYCMYDDLSLDGLGGMGNSEIEVLV